MNKLEEARIQIDEIDREIARLFEKRMAEVKKVIEYKIENKMPIFDQKRENEVIIKNLKYIENEELKPYFEALLNSLMTVSKAYQSRLHE